MQPRGTDAIPLPPRPNLEQYRHRAKSLVKACASGDADAVRSWARGWLESLGALHDENRSAEADAVETPRYLKWTEIDREIDAIEKDARSSRLIDGDGDASCTLADAQLFIARLHDFASWPRFVHHLEALERESSPDSAFETAADAVVTGDIARLSSMLRTNPSLSHARSARDHAATLLHYIAANGHEGYRQKTPKNAVDIARVLLDAGAEPDALARMYGYECTPMQMLVSSAHPHIAGLQVALVDILVDYGARPSGVNDDGSPLMTAFRFHYPRAAEALVRRGARVDNVISAAALGRTDLLADWVVDGATLAPDVHLAAVPWPRLKRDARIHLGYALTWAANWGKGDAVELLLQKGVDPNGKDDDATALHLAAAFGHMDIVRLLLAYGASLETLNSYDGTVLDGTLWYAYNGPVKGVDYPAVIRALIDAGARTDVYPEMQHWIDEYLKRG